jgi:hypothetical protein
MDLPGLSITPSSFDLIGSQLWVPGSADGTIQRFNLDGSSAGPNVAGCSSPAYALAVPTMPKIVPTTIVNGSPSGGCAGDGTCTISLSAVVGTGVLVAFTLTCNVPTASTPWYPTIIDQDNTIIAVDADGSSAVSALVGGEVAAGTYTFRGLLSSVDGAISSDATGYTNTVTITWAAPGTGDDGEAGGLIVGNIPSRTGTDLSVADAQGTPPGLLILERAAKVPGIQFGQYAWNTDGAQMPMPADGTYYLALSMDRGAFNYIRNTIGLQAYATLGAIPPGDVPVYQVTISGGTVTTYTPLMAGSWSLLRPGHAAVPLTESYPGELAILTGLAAGATQTVQPVWFTQGPSVPASVLLGNGPAADSVIYWGPMNAGSVAGYVLAPDGTLDKRERLAAICEDGAGGLFGVRAAPFVQGVNTFYIGAAEVLHRAGDASHPWVAITSGYGAGTNSAGSQPNQGNVANIARSPDGSQVFVCWYDAYQTIFIDTIQVSGGAVAYGAAITPLPNAQIVSGGGDISEQAGAATGEQDSELLVAAFPVV